MLDHTELLELTLTQEELKFPTPATLLEWA
jgi:hypothetical protein